MALSADDDKQLADIGSVLLSNFAAISTQLILYGIGLCFYIYAVVVILRRKHQTAASYWLLFLISLLFLCGTMAAGSFIAIIAVEIQLCLISPSVTLSARYQDSVNRLAPAFVLGAIDQALSFVVADGIVTWRAWVLYSHSKVARSSMAIAMIVNAGLFLCLIITTCIRISEYAVTPGIEAIINVAALFWSFLTNLIATSLIVNRLWNHRSGMNRTFLSEKSQVEQILVLLVETGFGFAVMQLISAVLTLFGTTYGTPIFIGWFVITEVTNFCAAIFPVVIVIIVGRENSSIIESVVSQELTPGTTAPEQVSHRPVSTIHFADSTTYQNATRISQGHERADVEVRNDSEKYRPPTTP